jgi:hypothetical protein
MQRKYTALIWAAQEGKIDCVRLLLEGGADQDARDEVRGTICRFLLCLLFLVDRVQFCRSSHATDEKAFALISSAFKAVFLLHFLAIPICFAHSKTLITCLIIIVFVYFAEIELFSDILLPASYFTI